MTKKLGVDGPLRDSPTVHSDIRAVLADTILMDDLREALLPDTTLTDHQHRHIGGCHLHGRADSVVEERACADDTEAVLDLLNIYVHLPSVILSHKDT